MSNAPIPPRHTPLESTKSIGLLYTTIATSQEAETLANLVIENKMASCVNTIPGGFSIYRWKDKIERSHETYMIFKTTIDLMDKLEKFILKNHPYDTPAILKFTPETSKDFWNYVSTSLEIQG